MDKCTRCYSYAINHHHHGRDGSDPNLCDVCFWRKRVERNHVRIGMISRLQKYMRDPERTLICDILANGQLLPDPKGERYGFPSTGNEHFEPQP